MFRFSKVGDIISTDNVYGPLWNDFITIQEESSLGWCPVLSSLYQIRWCLKSPTILEYTGWHINTLRECVQLNHDFFFEIEMFSKNACSSEASFRNPCLTLVILRVL